MASLYQQAWIQVFAIQAAVLSMSYMVHCMQTVEETLVESCEGESFEAKCKSGEVILMTNAMYGRMELGRCITESYGHIGCKVDVLDIMDSFCSGRPSCRVVANHPALIDRKKKACPKGLVGYLSAQYTCMKVHENPTLCKDKGYITLENDYGYLPSGSGSSQSHCSWRIVSGRKVNITMYNFSPPPAADQLMVSSSACYEIGIVKEASLTQPIHKCLSDPRKKQIYLSNDGTVDIVLSNTNDANVVGHFIIEYKGTGCKAPNVPDDARLERRGNQAKIICTISTQSWQLTCQNDMWIGDIGQCLADSKWSFLGLLDSSHTFGTAIVVGIGAAVGVLIGGILLYIVIAIFKRCQGDDSRNYEYTDASFTHAPIDYLGNKQLLVQDDILDQRFGTWGSQQHPNNITYPNNTTGRDGTNHSRVPLPPLPNDCNNMTLSYEKPAYNRN